MSKRKKDKYGNNNQQNFAEKLAANAAYKLKAFINDIMHDRYFSHRVFYPVMYQTKHFKNKDTVDIDTEFYLFKGEDTQVTSRALNAIIIANSVLVSPRDNPLTLEEMTYPKNKNIVFKRAKTFLVMLGDSNMYNFVIGALVRNNNVTENDVAELQKRFGMLVKGHKPNRTDLDIASLAQTKISSNVKKNIDYLSNIYRSAKEKEIISALNFLQHMGNSRTIVTDFVYNSLTTDKLDTLGGGVNEYSGDNSVLTALEELQAFTNDKRIEGLTVDYGAQFAKALLEEYDNRFGKKSTIKYFNTDANNIVKQRVIRTSSKIADLTKNYIKTTVFECWRSLCKENSKKTFFKNLMYHIVNDVVSGKMSSREVFEVYGSLSVFKHTQNQDDIYSIVYNLLQADIDYFNTVRQTQKDKSITTKITESKQSIFKNLNDIYSKIDNDIYSKMTDDMKSVLDLKSIENEAEKIYNNMKHGKPLPTFTSVTIRAIEKLVQGAKKKINESKLDSSTKYVIDNAYGLITYERVMQKFMDDLESTYDGLISSSDIMNKTSTYISMQVLDENKRRFDDYMMQFKHMSETFDELLSKLSEYLYRIANTKTDSDTPSKTYLIITAARNILKDTELVHQFFKRKDIFDAEKLENLQITDEVMKVYYATFLSPFMQEFLSHAIVDNMVSKISVNSRVLAKDILGLSNTLQPSNAGILTFELEAFNELSQMFCTFKGDTFMGIKYSSIDDAVEQMNRSFGIRYFNLFIIDKSTTHMYLNQVGDPYMFKGTKTNIRTSDLKDNYDYLTGPNGLYRKLVKDKNFNKK